MSKNKFLLLSLEDSSTKKIANAVNNRTSLKILEYLAQVEEATESEISKNTKLAISTVHYNLKQLLNAKLIDWENYHYSQKGKEVRHYKLANKYIIIAPKSDTSSLKEKLKNIIPTSLLTILGSYFIYKYQYTNQVADIAMAKSVAENTVMIAADHIPPPETSIITQILTSYVFWFILGAITIALTYIFVKFVNQKLKNKASN